MKRILTLAILLLSQLTAGHHAMAADIDRSIVSSKHNLSASGPGEIRAVSEDRICIFCHTPHNATPNTPLWNREVQPTTYDLYQSTTLSASPHQPSGPTRLCLSCHDGTIALGDVLRVRPGDGVVDGIITMTMEKITGDRGSYLGEDISNDHPVSFNYYESLPNLELSPVIPPELHTYGTGLVHCTTCHDPHDNQYGKFLVMSNNKSKLCTTCHVNVAGWSLSDHATSDKIWDPPGDQGAKSVADHACGSCHTPHGAGGPERLLRELKEEENCYPCHDGSLLGSPNIKAEFDKSSSHPVAVTTIGAGDYHDPTEDVSSLQGHVECVDCHNPHAVKSDQEPPEPPNASGALALVSGMDQTGINIVPSVTHEYELCFKCHGNSSDAQPFITRWVNENNTRREFDPDNPSYHPVVDVGKNSDVPSLRSSDEPEMTEDSMIFCTDCHDNNTSSAIGGTGPRGPHGSTFRPILRQQYDTVDPQVGGDLNAYALCYRCHDRTKLLDADRFFSASGHNQHVVVERAPCSACHDPHGVREVPGTGDHSHLINFDHAIVSPLGTNPTPLFEDLGSRSGQCFLVCHGITHKDVIEPEDNPETTVISVYSPSDPPPP